MASNICWSRANISPSHPNRGILCFRKNLTSRCSSSFNWSTAKKRALNGTLGVPNLSNGSPLQPATARGFSSPTTARAKRQKFDRDVIVSVLESSATRRDAKGYLQKYALPKTTSLVATSIQAVESQQKPLSRPAQAQLPLDVAIVLLRNPQKIRPDTMNGIAKTLTQLRALGLLSVVIVDCDLGERRSTFQSEALRLCEAIDSFGKPGASRLVENVLVSTSHYSGASPSPFWDDIYVQDYGILNRALQHNMITVIPSLAQNDETTSPAPADAQRASLALTRYFTGIQFEQNPGHGQNGSLGQGTETLVSVERVIILDPFGGTPVPGRPEACQRFVNLEQEYDTLLGHLEDGESSSSPESSRSEEANRAHAKNIKLARDTLWLLPETASVLITTPFAAANTSSLTSSAGLSPVRNSELKLGFDGMVTTRRRQNPLLHNLLTDKPVFSPSLPLRNQSPNLAQLDTEESIDATLVKRGMPLAIYPDPRTAPWSPSAPGEHRLQLTDESIDLNRLVTLIEDSFGRKLDVDDYLRRTNENLAGVIIAGEYEGCAILTWERPKDVDPQTAYEQGRFVPYLDKFAVLKSRQGSGGVADIIFNAMVRDCFPDGVLWRSRKDNPVNKWYFERSVGTSKLVGSNWAMFWTTLGLSARGQKLKDYEAVCREIMPSWADVVQ